MHAIARLALAAALSLAPAARAEWGRPQGFFQDEQIRETEVAPGVKWISAAGRHQDRPIESHLLVADLREDGITLGAMTGGRVLAAKSGQYVRRTTVSELSGRPGCLGAINVAFFDIGSTQATQGLVIERGRMLREPEAARPSLLVAADRSLHFAQVDWSGKIRLGKQSRPLAGVNRPQLAATEVVLYLPPWAISPGSGAAFSRDAGGLEIVIGPVKFTAATQTDQPGTLAGKITAIHTDGVSREIGAEQMVLRAGASAAPFFRHARAGDEVAVEWTLTGLPQGLAFHQVRDAISAQPLLIRAGEKLPGSGSFWTTRHPRSAVAVHRDGRQTILVVVDGRSAKSAGMSLDSLTAYLLHLGAHHAMNLDGGGSSAIATRVSGRVKVLNIPSDGRERPMPTGLGVMVPPSP